jgi:hypothetical protein
MENSDELLKRLLLEEEKSLPENFAKRKICRKCSEEKDISLFLKAEKCKDGHSHICLKCYSSLYKRTKEEQMKRDKERRIARQEKIKIKKEKRLLLEQKKNNKIAEQNKRQQLIEEEKLSNLLLFQSGKKVCKYCGETKPLDKFIKMKTCKDGHAKMCYNCSRDRHYHSKKEHHDKVAKAWRDANPDRIKAHRKTRQSKPDYKIKNTIRQRIIDILGSKSDRFSNYVGCTLKQLTEHLESQFTPEMNWGNYGKFWEVDHIIPVAAFDHSDKDETYWCWNYKNLQPLTKIANAAKWDSFPNGETVRDLRRDNPDKINEYKFKMLMELGILQFGY